VLANAGVDAALYGTVVAHFYYVLAGSVFSVIFGFRHWIGAMLAQEYNQMFGWTTVIGVNPTFFLVYFLRPAGMPRRIGSKPRPVEIRIVHLTIGRFEKRIADGGFG
jgi:cytochrome c oxidase subunit I